MLSALVVALAFAGFQEEMAQRNWSEAWESAGDSDSLRAEVLFESGLVEAAVLLHAMTLIEDPTPGRFAGLWRMIAAGETSPIMADLFRDQLLDYTPQDWDVEDLLLLREAGILLDDSITIRQATDIVFDRYPGSAEAAEIAGDIFYDSLYPVWYDDSARVDVLENFVLNYGYYSDLWRSRAYRYLLSAVTGTADSLEWSVYLEQWLNSCPGDPVACLTGAAMHIERDSSWQEALVLADRGLLHVDDWHPVGFDTMEFELEQPALRNNLLFRRCQALFGLERFDQAESELSRLLDPVLYPMSDYHSPSPFYWLAGEIALHRGDSLQAALLYIQSASLGDVVNRWAGRAESRLRELSPMEEEYLDWCREISGYNGPVFEDVTSLLGPDSLVRGSRVAWGDIDSNGYPDLLLGRNLYENTRGLAFREVTEEAGLSENTGTGGILGDLDMDGDLDMVTSGMPVQVFLNENGLFSESTYELGIFPTGYRIEGTGLLDWNADGWLDVYLASYEMPGLRGEGTQDLFYLGCGEGFREVGDSLGMIPFLEEHLCGRGVSPCDYDRDGDVDIFVSNYRLLEYLLWSNDSTTAANPALEKGMAGHVTDGWWGHTIGSAWGDYDCDGDWDIFCANLAHPRYIQFSDRSELLRNNDGTFEDVRADAGIRFEETLSNPVWGDFDNDGWLDLYITSVYVNRRSFLYLGSEDGTFTDVTFLSGARVFNGWGAATADFDRDGRLDLMVGSGTAPRLLQNLTEPGGYWLLVEIDRREGVNGSATGCVIEVTDGERIWLRQVEGGSGTTSQNDGLLHFGLPGPGQYTWRLFVPGASEPVASGSGITPGRLLTVR